MYCAHIKERANKIPYQRTSLESKVNAVGSAPHMKKPSILFRFNRHKYTEIYESFTFLLKIIKLGFHHLKRNIKSEMLVKTIKGEALLDKKF